MRVVCIKLGCSFKIEEFSVTAIYSFFTDFRENEFLNFKINSLKFSTIQFIVLKLKTSLL